MLRVFPSNDSIENSVGTWRRTFVFLIDKLSVNEKVFILALVCNNGTNKCKHESFQASIAQIRKPKLVYTYKHLHVSAQLCGRHLGYKIKSLDTLKHNEKL